MSFFSASPISRPRRIVVRVSGEPTSKDVLNGTAILVGAAVGGIAGYAVHGLVTAVLGIPIGALVGMRLG